MRIRWKKEEIELLTKLWTANLPADEIRDRIEEVFGHRRTLDSIWSKAKHLGLKRVFPGRVLPRSIPFDIPPPRIAEEELAKYKKPTELPEVVFLPHDFEGKLLRGPYTVTIAIGDTHFGHADFLPKTYYSAVNRLIRTLKVWKEQLILNKATIVFLGDLVSGKGLYREWTYDTLILKGHWQVQLADAMVGEFVEMIENVLPIRRIYLLRGTHEVSLGENFAIYLSNYLSKAVYAGGYLLKNVAAPRGKCNIFLSHGFGRSTYYPVSMEFVRSVWKTVSEYAAKGIPVERVCCGHCHWLQIGLNIEGIVIDEVGGFQRWLKKGAVGAYKRPSGFIVYLWSKQTGLIAVPIEPQPEVFMKERDDKTLEFSNMKFYGSKLALLRFPK